MSTFLYPAYPLTSDSFWSMSLCLLPEYSAFLMVWVNAVDFFHNWWRFRVGSMAARRHVYSVLVLAWAMLSLAVTATFTLSGHSFLLPRCNLSIGGKWWDSYGGKRARIYPVSLAHCASRKYMFYWCQQSTENWPPIVLYHKRKKRKLTRLLRLQDSRRLQSTPGRQHLKRQHTHTYT